MGKSGFFWGICFRFNLIFLIHLIFLILNIGYQYISIFFLFPVDFLFVDLQYFKNFILFMFRFGFNRGIVRKNFDNRRGDWFFIRKRTFNLIL